MEDQKPCHCPLLGCDFVASSEVLSNHFSQKHGDSQTRFSYGHNFVVYLKSKQSDDETIVLHEENDGKLFIIKNKTMFLGNVVIICCIGPNSSEYSYDMMARFQKCKLKLQSFAKNITEFTLATLESGFLVVPFSSSRLIKLEICIMPVPMMQIIIKMLDQRELPLSVKSSDTIGNVMRQIFDKEGILYADQRLIFSGKQLEHHQTLADYNIEENSTIFLVLRLMGS
ncbi:E3 ubiquitin-protein ligase SINA [Trifolium repens]|nr:E3 ubiquitin-protein ligase SINA [Trifolium repens]